MSIRIEVPSYFQSHADNMKTLEVDGSTVGECVSCLVNRFPALRKMLLDEEGKLLGHLSVYINGECAYPDGLGAPVKDGDEIYVLFSIEGG